MAGAAHCVDESQGHASLGAWAGWCELHLLVVGVALPRLHQHDHDAVAQAPRLMRRRHRVRDLRRDVVVWELRLVLAPHGQDELSRSAASYIPHCVAAEVTQRAALAL